MFNNDWDYILEKYINNPSFNELQVFLDEEYNRGPVYPKKDNIFRAFKLTSYEDTKVVIIGQDPYYNENQANGLAFSVNEGVPLPPSLKNIYKEIFDDLSIINDGGDLSPWAKQGVLLLNAVLTVRAKEPKSHSKTYWTEFTDGVIKEVSKKGNVIFLLWGNDAIDKSKLIEDGNFILTSSHPSPLSAYRGFLGSKIFSRTNEILKSLGKEEIDWQI